jgi:beta-aspartyl-peptidase (threonine type)
MSSVGLFAAVCMVTLWRQKRSIGKKSCNIGDFAIIVHGGAYAIPEDVKEACEIGCRVAAQAGYAVLAAGGSALDGVEAAIISLENNPCFDAGYGSVLTVDSKVEMDAVIMDGSTLNAGAVACVSSVRNPISLARKVMEKTNHVLIVGAGADKFARKMGFEEVGAEDLTTDATRAELALYMQEEDPYGASVTSDFNRPNESKFQGMGHDTTGCVCIDVNGNICSGTSTGTCV